MNHTSRLAALAAATLATALTFAGCSAGGTSTPSGSAQAVTIRFAWWGSDARHTATQAAIAAFEKANPQITVAPEFGDWSGYWDRLATQAAGNNMPDVIQMSDAYLAEYAGRGALLPLDNRREIDLTDLDQGGVAAGEVDGTLYALQAGANFPALLINPSLFQRAGVAIPNDKTWTWDDYRKTAEALSKAKVGAVGTDSIIGDPVTNAWLVQHGKSLFTSDGKLGFDDTDLTAFFQLISDMSASGAAPASSLITEQMPLSADQWGLAKGKSAMGFAWSNLLTTIEKALGSPLQVLRLPADSSAKASGMYLRGAMYYSVSSKTAHPAESAKLVNFLLSDPAAANELLAERGLPLNSKIREQIKDKVSEPQQRLIAFTVDNADAFGDAPAVPGVGGSTYDQVVQRAVSDVLFGKIDAAAASKKVHSELAALLTAAR